MDDCIIIGAGPAGLTAAIYLARFHLSIRMFDCGSSRAATIPCTRNHAGYPEGIPGRELVARMLAQAERYGATCERAEATAIEPDGDTFTIVTDAAALDTAGIARVDGPYGGVAIEGDRMALDTAVGRLSFDSIYPALGSVIRSGLAVAAGAHATDEGCLEVDEHQRTSVPGLFAAGDVVKGLDQISHAMGEAGVAATTIRNMLDERRALRR